MSSMAEAVSAIRTWNIIQLEGYDNMMARFAEWKKEKGIDSDNTNSYNNNNE